MGLLLIKRLFGAFITLLIITVFIFILIRLTPGGPAQFLIDPDALNTQNQAAINKALGLDRPWYEQLGRWIVDMLSGNVGISYFHRRPAMEVVLERLPYTLLLTTVSFVLSFGAAISLGLWAARKRGMVDRLVTGLATITLAFPLVWISLLLLVLLAGWLPIFPTSGTHTLNGDGGLLDFLWHLTLPALALATHSFGAVCLAVRNRAIEELNADYSRVAYSKGLSDSQVVRRHVLKMSLNPAIALSAVAIPGMISGSIAVEAVFSYPGIGLLAYDSFRQRDYPVAVGIAMVAALVAIAASWASEFITRRLDPRLRESRVAA